MLRPVPSTTENSLRLADLLAAYSVVADMGFGLPQQEAMRTCLVATALGRKMNLPEPVIHDAFYVSLLMHIGCIAMSHESAGIWGDELTMTRAVARTNLGSPTDFFITFFPQMSAGLSAAGRTRLAAMIALKGRSFGKWYDTGACEIARETARRLGLPQTTQHALNHEAEAWRGGGAPSGLKGDDIPLGARLARVAAEAAFFEDIGDASLAIEAVRARSGKLLDPEICEAFIKSADGLLAEALTGDPRQRIVEVEPEPVIERREDEVVGVAEALGHAADLKTPFLQGHSTEVARLSMLTAERLRLDEATRWNLNIAALLHDVGRVAISNVIWEKPGTLTSTEWEQVRMHPYHSERVLATSRAFAPAARLAGTHHERLDGSGYHRACGRNELPTAARVLALADAFAAMTHKRPYRDALDPQDASEALTRGAKDGTFDPDLTRAFIEVASNKPWSVRRIYPAGLSDREVEVLRLVAEGCSNPDIAERLHISRRTAEHHVQHVYTKIGRSSRAGAALFALEHELLGN
jgi:HD-GYP domain-containing protein (c-di-GMP phosphodiesterase class II)